jgi:hypothetical protein
MAPTNANNIHYQTLAAKRDEPLSPPVSIPEPSKHNPTPESWKYAGIVAAIVFVLCVRIYVTSRWRQRRHNQRLECRKQTIQESSSDRRPQISATKMSISKPSGLLCDLKLDEANRLMVSRISSVSLSPKPFSQKLESQKLSTIVELPSRENSCSA